MGQGQEVTARRLLLDCMVTGQWLLLQNCHLSLAFSTEIMETLGETTLIHPDFRLWLTTEHHVEFPVGLLQVYCS
jgi:dynein heavy chain